MIVAVPIVRIDAAGTRVEGTAEVFWHGSRVGLREFRDLDGNELPLPPGSCYQVDPDLLRVVLPVAEDP